MNDPERGGDGDDAVARQLAMTRQTWKQLQKHGVDDDTELRLDFFFECPTRARASELAEFLREETDYEVHVTSDRDRWVVRGQTQPTSVSARILEEWSEWMVLAGARHQCRFDGWGAEVP